MLQIEFPETYELVADENQIYLWRVRETAWPRHNSLDSILYEPGGLAKRWWTFYLRAMADKLKENGLMCAPLIVWKMMDNLEHKRAGLQEVNRDADAGDILLQKE